MYNTRKVFNEDNNAAIEGQEGVVDLNEVQGTEAIPAEQERKHHEGMGNDDEHH